MLSTRKPITTLGVSFAAASASAAAAAATENHIVNPQ